MRRDQGRVVAAEAEGVIQSDAHFSFRGPRSACNPSRILSRIFQVDCWRNYGIPNGKGARGHFYSASAANRWPVIDFVELMGTYKRSRRRPV
jgi:hypothetical protein